MVSEQQEWALKEKHTQSLSITIIFPTALSRSPIPKIITTAIIAAFASQFPSRIPAWPPLRDAGTGITENSPPLKNSSPTIKNHPRHANTTHIRCKNMVMRKVCSREGCVSHHRPTEADNARVAIVVMIPLSPECQTLELSPSETKSKT